MLVFAGFTSQSQTVTRPQPVWWFGVSGAANINQYRGTTQMLNNSVTVPTAFHKGDGVKPYISLLTEYRPNKKWGGMLNVAYDNRGGKFDQVITPCNCPADLSSTVSYIAIEPSVRFAPIPASSFYVFAGPTLSFNVRKGFTYAQDKQVDQKGDWSDIRSTLLSAQAGLGIDLPISPKTSATQFTLSPFASFLTDFGHDPRAVESWSLYTIRAGVALKFGKARKASPSNIATTPTGVTGKEVQFSVRAPKAVPVNRQIKETFALRNSVFFDNGSSAIPNRYIQLSSTKATAFKEAQLQQSQPDNLNKGRSARQLAVYHNILNIIGDRMRANPTSTITLTGASDNNPAEGKVMAENIKQYLVNAFGINASRITTVGRDKPMIPSEQPGGTKELVLLREGDRRVDIVSTSPELLLQVGGSTSPFLKPVQITAVQEDPLDSHVIFNAGNANELLKSWTVDVTDDQGKMQHYGPYTKDQASIPGKTILGNNATGNYKIVMQGETKSGQAIRKQTSVSLVKAEDPKQEGLRYSILFDFDKSKTIASYEKFLTGVVTPLIPANGIVIIHGHTDIIGDEKYNHALSTERATGVQKIIESALAKAGKKGVKFETYGFGEDTDMTPFENNLPEERFYNRTVIIDIVPGK
jgi:outer membrane protein OmpA-like peptidoglycan-associated protein